MCFARRLFIGEFGSDRVASEHDDKARIKDFLLSGADPNVVVYRLVFFDNFTLHVWHEDGLHSGRFLEEDAFPSLHPFSVAKSRMRQATQASSQGHFKIESISSPLLWAASQHDIELMTYLVLCVGASFNEVLCRIPEDHRLEQYLCNPLIAT